VNEILSIYLVPSNELGKQVCEHFKDLSIYCSETVTCLHLTELIEKKERKKKLREKPKMIVTTPNQLLISLDKKELNLETIETIIIDEADFLLSEGNISSIDQLKSKYLKKGVYQCLMISATLDSDLIQSNLFHNPGN
jgi:ATP-dependent RNA helicase DDX56/DBP9